MCLPWKEWQSQGDCNVMHICERRGKQLNNPYSASVKELLWFAHTMLQGSMKASDGKVTVDSGIRYYQGLPLFGIKSAFSTTIVP